jgi:hypothetical protein
VLVAKGKPEGNAVKVIAILSESAYFKRLAGNAENSSLEAASEHS